MILTCPACKILHEVKVWKNEDGSFKYWCKNAKKFVFGKFKKVMNGPSL